MLPANRNIQVLPQRLEIAVQKEKVLIPQGWTPVRISLEVEVGISTSCTWPQLSEAPRSPRSFPCVLSHTQARPESSVEFLTENWPGRGSHSEAHSLTSLMHTISQQSSQGLFSPFLLSVMIEKSDAVSEGFKEKEIEIHDSDDLIILQIIVFSSGNLA